MGYLKDIVDTIKDISVIAKTATNRNNADSKSIAKKAKEGILQFPAICSNSIEIDRLQNICKALEKQYASFVQVAYTLDPVAVFNGKKGSSNVTDYIRKFHNNTGSVSFADVINVAVDTIDRAMESYEFFELENTVLECLLLDGTSNEVISKNILGLKPYLEGFNETTVNDMCKPLLRGMIENTLTEAVDPRISDAARNARRGIPREKVDPETSSAVSMLAVQTGGCIPERVLQDNDVRKSNELVPTTMRLRVNAMDSNGTLNGYVEFVIGIKVTIHPVSSVEVVNNLSGVGRDKFFNFIRWTSGEISLFRDLLFNIDQIKTDALNNNARGGGSGWWATLRRMKAQSNIIRRFGGKSIIPNATIVVNMEEVEVIKAKTGVDLLNPVVAKKMMNQYLLLGFVIVDASTESVHFLFDSEVDYQVNSFNGLKREAQNGSNNADFKEMMKMINRF